VIELPSYPGAASEREREAAQEPPGPSGVVYSGWWRRAGALRVDTFAYAAFLVAVIAAGFGLSQLDSNAVAVALIFGAIFTIVGPIWYVIWALLDYLWPLWDGRNQTLHDKVANSIVVRV
jgi:hypothetical protein